MKISFKSHWNHEVVSHFSCSVMSDSLRPHGLQHARLSCPSPIPGACSNSCPSSRWYHPTISSSVICQEPAWGIPPMAKVMRKGAWQNAKAGSGLRGPSGFSWASTPETSVCLLYCVMLSTYSSDIIGELSPHHLFLEKVNLELLDNKSPGHNKSVSIQKPSDSFLVCLTGLSGLLELHMWLFVASRPQDAQEA